MKRDELLRAATDYYLTSGDFNGLDVPDGVNIDVVIQLVEEVLLSLNSGDRHPNAHIKAFDPEPIDEQVAKIRSEGLGGCLYPEPKHLVVVVDRSQYEGRPFALRLALGEPQLKLAYFDL